MVATGLAFGWGLIKKGRGFECVCTTQISVSSLENYCSGKLVVQEEIEKICEPICLRYSYNGRSNLEALL